MDKILNVFLASHHEAIQHNECFFFLVCEAFEKNSGKPKPPKRHASHVKNILSSFL